MVNRRLNLLGAAFAGGVEMLKFYFVRGDVDGDLRSPKLSGDSLNWRLRRQWAGAVGIILEPRRALPILGHQSTPLSRPEYETKDTFTSILLTADRASGPNPAN
jgi:hypothetical protein